MCFCCLCVTSAGHVVMILRYCRHGPDIHPHARFLRPHASLQSSVPPCFLTFCIEVTEGNSKMAGSMCGEKMLGLWRRPNGILRTMYHTTLCAHRQTCAGMIKCRYRHQDSVMLGHRCVLQFWLPAMYTWVD